MESVVNRLVAALRRPEGALSPWIVTPDRHLVDALARTRFDAVTFDLQHGGFSVETAASCAAAAALAGKPTLARVALGDVAGAARLVDAGVAAIIAPMIDNAAQAAALVEAIKYPPVGRRSWGPGLATALLGAPGAEYFARANASTLAFAMIETREGYAALDAILATPGIDGVFVGPSDFSIALTGGIAPHGPEVGAALTRISERARAHDKFAALYCFDGAGAKAALARGFKLRTISTDLELLCDAAEAQIAAAHA